MRTLIISSIRVDLQRISGAKRLKASVCSVVCRGSLGGLKNWKCQGLLKIGSRFWRRLMPFGLRKITGIFKGRPAQWRRCFNLLSYAVKGAQGATGVPPRRILWTNRHTTASHRLFWLLSTERRWGDCLFKGLLLFQALWRRCLEILPKRFNFIRRNQFLSWFKENKKKISKEEDDFQEGFKWEERSPEWELHIWLEIDPLCQDKEEEKINRSGCFLLFICILLSILCSSSAPCLMSLHCCW